MLPSQMQHFEAYVEKAVICRTPAYQDMYRRPYNMNISTDIVNTIGGMSNGVDYSRERLAPIAASVITPQTHVESVCEMPNAWGSERCLFILKIVHGNPNDVGVSKRSQYLTGYTDRMGMMQANGIGDVLIDPQMRLFFNTSMLFNEITHIDGYGHRHVTAQPLMASQLVMGQCGGVHGQNDRTLRPEDIYSAINVGMMIQNAGAYDQSRGVGGSPIDRMYDGRTAFQPGQPYKLSHLNNLVPSNYLSKVLQTAATEQITLGGQHANPADTSNQIATQLNEGYLTNDMTLQHVLDRTGLRENRSITFQELRTLLPNIDQPGVMIKAGMEGVNTGRVEGAVGGAGSEYHNAANYETVIANMLNNVVTALMMDLMVGSVHLTGNNMSMSDATTGTLSGQFSLQAGYATSFVDGRDAVQLCEVLKARLVREFLTSFTGHNHVPLVFSVQASLMAETIVDISYNGKPTTRFVFPVFANAAFTPIVTSDQNHLNSIAVHTRELVQQLTNVF